MKEGNGYKEKNEGKLLTWIGCLLRPTETIFIKTWKYPAGDEIHSYSLEALQLPTGLSQKTSTL
jgi:hypothetical protein